ncbi:peptidoglycan/xylan/chitin deacetylase (PgdA/CDA1 family) [Streptosporangium becharense]|uniref:Peptidoglycan/xylan/chitin deacetylase (PgdA/CDA1 family) n=1 Tax=Streptosporangium becharense TaxID=1816182 RepID=A0A7W9IJ46_9ACTN|nr:polysaccharide deacetylase family protein [Streptosporangium becharense]MBB2913818.1 peptidoglycan/xylan/chitin deacetylase (PgdA/CDA1 family) [Streptosporangium becharense]MBB5821521.1 peptidoglycan/xylan/chitin deacetylase (PgdA/CDA1 family) [Streptosporangium becharense]
MRLWIVVVVSLLVAAGCAAPLSPADRPAQGDRPSKADRSTGTDRRHPGAGPGEAGAGWSSRPGGPLPVPPPVRRTDCRRVKCVALTFDDGPGPYTRPLLDVLARHRARATFFVLGRRVAGDGTGTVRRMVADGHELGNHSWDHPILSDLPKPGIRRQLRRTQLAVEHATGVRMALVRPPYGATGHRVAAESRRQGLAQVLWNVDTLDWRDRRASAVVRRATGIRPGAVVLLHDIHPSTVWAVPRLLRRLTTRGYTFVTLSEMYGGGRLRPGRRYYDAAGRWRGDGGRPKPVARWGHELQRFPRRGVPLLRGS